MAVQFMPGSDVLVVVPSTWNSYNVESRKYDVPVVKLDRDAVAENLSGMLTLNAGVPGGGGGVPPPIELSMVKAYVLVALPQPYTSR